MKDVDRVRLHDMIDTGRPGRIKVVVAAVRMVLVTAALVPLAVAGRIKHVVVAGRMIVGESEDRAVAIGEKRLGNLGKQIAVMKTGNRRAQELVMIIGVNCEQVANLRPFEIDHPDILRG